MDEFGEYPKMFAELLDGHDFEFEAYPVLTPALKFHIKLSLFFSVCSIAFANWEAVWGPPCSDLSFSMTDLRIAKTAEAACFPASTPG